MTDFIDKHGLWNDEQRAAARDALDVVTNKALRRVRVSVADPQGKLRSKTVMQGSFKSVLRHGVSRLRTLNIATEFQLGRIWRTTPLPRVASWECRRWLDLPVSF